MTEAGIDAIVNELRQHRPAAPETLRDRVGIVAACEPGGAAWRRFAAPISMRRALLVAVPMCLAVGLGAALVQAVLSASGTGRVSADSSALKQAPAAGAQTVPNWGPRVPTPSSPEGHDTYAPFYGRGIPGRTRDKALQSQATGANTGTRAAGVAESAAPLPPSGTRLQAYDANLRIRVRDNAALSSATRRAMQIARSLGGHVVSVSFNTPGREGFAALRLRVPIGRVQTAVARFSSLGTLAGQQFRVEDLQREFNVRRDRMTKLRARIARLETALRNPSLSPEAKASLEAQLAGARQLLTRLSRTNRQTVRRASLATVSLALTSREESAAVPEPPGRIGRALRDAGTILAKEIAWVLYGLIVVAPLLLLGGLAFAAARVARRRGDRVLLERP
ncbi:MAG: DUF4349 domain-containing protein [Actinobacteria bacterium]|nr:DUF4349 domain-containing protein [Actinomycetota bacterium]